MDSSFNEFTNYLYSIGIINQQNFKELLVNYSKYKILYQDQSCGKSVSSIKTPNSPNTSRDLINSTKDMMTTVLFEFMIKKDDSFIQNMCYDIVSKFSESSFLEKSKSAKKFMYVYMKFHREKLQFNFQRWKKNIRKRWNIQPNNSVMTTEMKKQQDELMSCTFKPEINKSSRSMVKLRNKSMYGIQGLDTFTRLYHDYSNMKTKLAIRKEQSDKKESELMKTIPNISNMNSSFYSQGGLCSKSFFERRSEYISIKEKNKERILKENLEAESMAYTFTPEINNTFTINMHVVDRLSR